MILLFAQEYELMSKKIRSSSDHPVEAHHTEVDQGSPLAEEGGFAEKVAHHTGLEHERYISQCHNIKTDKEETFPMSFRINLRQDSAICFDRFTHLEEGNLPDPGRSPEAVGHNLDLVEDTVVLAAVGRSPVLEGVGHKEHHRGLRRIQVHQLVGCSSDLGHRSSSRWHQGAVLRSTYRV